PIWLGLADLLLTAGNTFRKSLDKNGGFPPGKGEPTEMKGQMKELLDRLKAVDGLETALAALRQLPASCYPDCQWQVLRALVELLPLAAAELWLVFRQEAKTDFAAVATRALAALGSVDDPSELLLQLDARVRHILVDEFQDTSYLQYHLLQHLTAGWQPDDGRTLFVVGDPMQSIYLFREAEVGLFLRARSRGIGTVQLERLDLCSNFRSQQGVVDWVNETFARLFPAAEDEALGGVVYAESAAVHAPLPGAACVVHPLAGRDDVAEAALVAELAQQALAAHPEQTVAVLVRARTHLPEILRALAERKLRFTARDIDLLECRPVVRDLLALTRALLHPADRLSWLCVLRAPWCGLSLADLEALCGDDKERTIPESLGDARVLKTLSEDGRQRAARIQAVMQRGQQRRGAISLRRLVEGVWLALGGAACYDEAALKDAGMVFTLMEDCDKGGELESLDALDEGVRKLFASPDTGADGRLQVMTIHKSKGLEFDTVILPGLGRGPAGGDRHLLRWLEHPDHGLLLAPVAASDGRSKDAIYEAIGRLEAEKQELETLRLLYVAATRAKERLHLLGHAKANKDGEPRPLAGSLLHKLWPAVQARFVVADAAAEGEETPCRERSPVAIRRLPADWQLPELRSVALVGAMQISQPSKHRKPGEQELFSGWEAETSRHVGTLTHHYLERIARAGLDRWSPGRIESEKPAALRRLNRLGVPAAELEAGWTRVVAALNSSLASDRGRWILGRHEQDACELQLSGLVDGSLVHAVIDRTFIDAGVRWIVDYKVVEMAGKGEQAFLKEQLAKYRSQLQAYINLIRQLEPQREVRAALYFPLSDGWVEVGLA
ncbi:UvrD-helicase domain-containing protein, partial [Trichloromonas sp.]|uniref:UvrD-helicase domain-containing protein n=1 Tax=Trichloromonas sp. TaxID=3069249 RepID=UPI003D819A8E